MGWTNNSSDDLSPCRFFSFWTRVPLGYIVRSHPCSRLSLVFPSHCRTTFVATAFFRPEAWPLFLQHIGVHDQQPHSRDHSLCNGASRIRFLLWASYMRLLLYVGVFIRQNKDLLCHPFRSEDRRVQMRVFTDFEFA